ncbi:MAG: Pr6Pr family membrane protein [Eubacteriaceae bacterium]|nr:Pr6Pr family membrane protein [Eubacteriaceae bacterium]
MQRNNIGQKAVIYRIFAFCFSLWGILAHINVFSDIRIRGLLTYTVQSNIFVCGVFLILAVRSISLYRRDRSSVDYGFFPALSFSAVIDILLTMLIFWVVLAPTNWAGLDLFSADNLAVHLFTPILIFLDRIFFYKYSQMNKKDILYVMIFPYIYVIVSSVIGLNRLVMFEGPGGGSYYLYPFLNFDRLGGMVFVNIILLSIFFLLVSCFLHRMETKRSLKHRKNQ